MAEALAVIKLFTVLEKLGEALFFVVLFVSVFGWLTFVKKKEQMNLLIDQDEGEKERNLDRDYHVD